MPPISRPLATPAAPPTVLTKDSAIASTANKCNSIRDPKDKFKNKDRVAEARAQQLQKNEQRKHQPIMRPLATPSQPGTVLSKSLAGLFTSKSSASDSRQNQHMHKKENGLPVVDIRTTEQFQNSSHHPGHSTPMLSIAVLKPIERTAQQQGKATAMAASFELNKQLLHSDKKVVKEKGVDNYEMTDNEDNSDSDDGSACSRASEAKRVPDWAKSKNLVPALERQYSKDYKVDPDELFGEVTSCDLAAIFNKKSKKYNRRNSSGEWSAHRVTSAEKQAYKLAVM